MGLRLNHVKALFLLWFLQTANAKLMYVNGVQQKDLTPVKPHDIDALFSGLEMFKKVASRGANADAKLQEESAKISNGHHNKPSSNTNSNLLQIHDVPKLSNDTRMAEGGSNLNLSKIEIPPKIGEIRLERGVGAMFDVMDHIQTLLEVMRTNVSKPNIFITNFALKQTDEIDLNH